MYVKLRYSEKATFFEISQSVLQVITNVKEIRRVFQKYSTPIGRTIIQHEIRNCFSPTEHRLILLTFFNIFFVAK